MWHVENAFQIRCCILIVWRHCAFGQMFHDCLPFIRGVHTLSRISKEANLLKFRELHKKRLLSACQLLRVIAKKTPYQKLQNTDLGSLINHQVVKGYTSEEASFPNGGTV